MIKRRGGGYFSGLVLGALIGAGVYHFLNHTKDGQKVKIKLKQEGKKALDQLVDTVAELEEKGEDFKQKAKVLQSELEKKAKGKTEQVAKEAKDGLKKIEALREKGRLTSRFFTKNGRSLSKPEKAS